MKGILVIIAIMMIANPVTAAGLEIEVKSFEHPSPYIKNPQRGENSFLSETILTVCVTAQGEPIPNADLRLSYERKGEKEADYYKTDLWGEAKVELPFIEFGAVNVTIDAVVHSAEGFEALSGSLNITIVGYRR